MLFSIHTGFHATDSGMLMKSLRKCQRLFDRECVALPDPKSYRKLLGQTMRILDGDLATPETQEVLRDAVLLEAADHEIRDDIQRVIISHEEFLGYAVDVFRDGGFYPDAPLRAISLRSVFAAHEVEFHVAIRNPATFIPALVALKWHDRSYEQLLGTVDPTTLRWSSVIADLHAAVPDCVINVWAYEDSPLLWSQIIREVAGLDPNTPIRGGFDFISKIMDKEGMRRMRAYLTTHKVENEIQLRRVYTAFLDKYVLDEELEDEIDLPGWTDDMVAHMTESYEEDLYAIARIPGVTLLTP